MATIQELATEMKTALQNSNEYKNVYEAFLQVKNDPQASSIFNQFQSFQQQIQAKLQQGQQPTVEDQQMSQQLAYQAQQNEKIVNLMNAEQQLNALITNVNKIIMQPLESLYIG